jgi:hypothetical protein
MFANPVDELVAVNQIESALKRYCRAVDRSDWELLRTVYHPGAHLDHGLYTGDVEGFVAWVAERRRYMLHTAHLIANVSVDFKSATLAVVETYGAASQRYRAPAPIVAEGFVEARVTSTYRYVDRFEAIDGEWRISKAILVTGDRQTQQLAQPVPYDPREVVQQPTTEDVLYRFLAD